MTGRKKVKLQFGDEWLAPLSIHSHAKCKTNKNGCVSNPSYYSDSDESIRDVNVSDGHGRGLLLSHLSVEKMNLADTSRKLLLNVAAEEGDCQTQRRHDCRRLTGTVSGRGFDSPHLHKLFVLALAGVMRNAMGARYVLKEFSRRAVAAYCRPFLANYEGMN